MVRKHKARADGMAVTDEGGKLVYKRDKLVVELVRCRYEADGAS